MSRPSTYTPDLAARICEAVADGRYLSTLCAQADMPTRSTIYLWLAAHREFSDMYARAREQRADLIADEIIAIADNEADPNRARVKIDARKWAAAKLNPKRYSDRVTHQGDGEAPVRAITRIELVAGAPGKGDDADESA
jgi:hypothetical protein